MTPNDWESIWTYTFVIFLFLCRQVGCEFVCHLWIDLDRLTGISGQPFRREYFISPTRVMWVPMARETEAPSRAADAHSRGIRCSSEVGLGRHSASVYCNTTFINTSPLDCLLLNKYLSPLQGTIIIFWIISSCSLLHILCSSNKELLAVPSPHPLLTTHIPQHNQ